MGSSCSVRFSTSADMEKSKKRSAVASSKLGAVEGTNRDKDKLVGKCQKYIVKLHA